MKILLMSNRKLLPVIFFLLCIMLTSNGLAQQIVISGKITSGTTNEPLPGATILEKGTQNGTTSGVTGNYTISVKPNATLVFTFIGMTSQEIPVAQSQTLDVILIESISTLDEIVVTGYQTQRKVDLTGAIAVEIGRAHV